MLTLQEADEEYKAVIAECKAAAAANRDEIVYYKKQVAILPKMPDGTFGCLRLMLRCKQGKEKIFVIAIPTSLTALVCKFCHDGVSHPGYHRTIATIALRYYWPKMRADVKDHIAACRHCGRRKVGTSGAKIPVQRYPIPQRPFQLWHYDITGKLPLTRSGNSYMFMVKEKLSKWLVQVALANKSKETLANVIVKEVYMKFGVPEVVVSDDGGEFKNGLMASIDRLLAAKHIFTTPYNPSSNGCAENQMRTTKDMMAYHTNHRQDDWDEHLDVVTFHYNTTHCEATGFSPFRVLFGREARQPSDEFIRAFSTKPPQEIHKMARELQTRLLQTWEDCGDAIQAHQDTITRRECAHASQRVFRGFKEGESFYMKLVPKLRFIEEHTDGEVVKRKLAAKLQYRYTGPYVVKRELSPVTYVCEVEGQEKVVSMVNMKRNPVKAGAIRITRLRIPIAEDEDEVMDLHIDEEDELIEEVGDSEEDTQTMDSERLEGVPQLYG